MAQVCLGKTKAHTVATVWAFELEFLYGCRSVVFQPPGFLRFPTQHLCYHSKLTLNLTNRTTGG